VDVVVERAMSMLPAISQLPAHPHGRAVRICFLDLLLTAFSKGLQYSDDSAASAGLQLALDWAWHEGPGIDAAVRARCLKVRYRAFDQQFRHL
jgi:hypothetical protein